MNNAPVVQVHAFQLDIFLSENFEVMGKVTISWIALFNSGYTHCPGVIIYRGPFHTQKYL